MTEERGQQTDGEVYTTEHGAAVPSVFTGDWQLLLCAGSEEDRFWGRQKNGFRGRIAEVAEKRVSCLSWKYLQSRVNRSFIAAGKQDVSKK